MADTAEVIHFGETQHFECQVIGYPTPTISWFKDDVDITENPRYNIHYEEDKGIITLMMKEIAAADEGCYVCRAENSEGYATTTAFLVVRVDRGVGTSKDFTSMMVEKVSEEELSHVEVIKSGKQTVIEEVITRVEETEREVFEEMPVGPKIAYDTVLRDPLTLKNENDLYIEVDISGFPGPQVRWYQGDNLLDETARITIERNPGWSLIKVKGVTSQDAGVYKVVAENVAGTDTASFHVSVQGPPSPPRNLRVVEVYKDYIIVEWEAPEDDGGDLVTGYIIDKSISGEVLVQAGRVDATTRRFKLTKLYEGNEYMIHVRAENRTGLSQPAKLDKPVKARLPFDPPGPPKSLQIKETYKDYIVVGWEAPEYDGGSKIFQYIVEKKDATRVSGMWVIAGTVDANVLNYKVTKLFQGNKYLFRVSAENKVGPGEAAEMKEPVEAKLPYDKPLPPRNIRAVETNRDYIVVEWDAPESDGGSPITGYVLEKRDAKRAGYIYIADVDAQTRQYKATRLFEGYDYYFRVIAENQVGPSEPCEMAKPARAKLPYDEPDAPTNLRVKEYWSDHITITWDKPEKDGGCPITGYIVEKRDALRSTWVKAGSVSHDVTTFKAENLFEGAEYVFRVFAENKVGPSQKAAEMTTPCRAKMPFDPPFAPRNMKILEYNIDHITLGWEAPEYDGGAPIQRYVIERRDALMSTWTQAGAVDKDTFKFKVDHLFEGQNYFFRIAAENECGRGKYIETEKPVTARLPYDKPLAPQGLHVVDVWKDYINLAWEAPENDGGSPLTGYTIEQRDAYEVGYKYVASVDAGQSGFQVTNLEEGHEYYFRVFAQNAAGLSNKPAEIKPPVKARLPFEKPSAPTDLHVTGTGPGKISIAWEPPVDDGGAVVSNYIIEIRDVLGTTFSTAAEVDGVTLKYNLLGLQDKGEYYIRVRAKNLAGVGKDAVELENPVTARTPIKSPGPPRNLEVLDTDSDRITVEWEEPSSDGGAPITGYQIEVCPENETEFKPVGRVRGKTRAFTVDGLKEGQSYLVRVKSENPAGVSESAAELKKPVTAKPPIQLPAAPRNLHVVDSSEKHITVQWEEPKFDGGAPITEYIVEMCRPKGDYKLAGRVQAPKTDYTASDLTAGDKYYIRVKAENPAGLSKSAAELSKPVTAKLPYDVPSNPQNLRVTHQDKDHLTVEWDKPKKDGGSPITSYQVEMCTSKDEFRAVGTVSGDVTKYTAEELIEGERYYVRVKAENAAGVSKMAAEMNKPVVAKPSYDAPGTPRRLHVTETDKDHITIEWEAPKSDGGSPVTGYVVEICSTKDLDFSFAGRVDGTTTKYRVDSVNAGEKYYLRVKAENAAGLSPKAAEIDKAVAAKPPFDPPSEPRNLQVTNLDKDRCALAWDTPISTGGSPVTAYVIEMCTPKDDFHPVGEVDGSTTTYTATELTEGERYFVRVKAQNPAGQSEEAAEMKRPIIPKTPLGKPSPPKNFKVHEVTVDSVSLVWETPESDGGSPILQFAVEKRELPDGKFSLAKTLPSGTCDAFLGGLKPNQNYAFRVFSENEVGRSEFPAELPEAVKTQRGISEPSAPRNLAVKGVTYKSIDIEWEAPEDDGGEIVTQYLIVMRETGKKKFKKVGKTDRRTLNFTLTSNLEEEHEYYIRVYAENKIGVSEEAAETAAIRIPLFGEEREVVEEQELIPCEQEAVQKAPPKKPKSEEVEPATGEAIRAEPVEEPLSQAEEKPPADALKPEDEVEEFVDALSMPVEQTAPGAPLNLVVTSLSTDGVSLEWEAPQDDGGTAVKSYIVVMRETDKAKFKKVGRTENGSLSLTVSKVKQGHEYYFRVYAENDIGISEESAQLDQCVKIPKIDKAGKGKVDKVDEKVVEKKQVVEEEVCTKSEEVTEIEKKLEEKAELKEEILHPEEEALVMKKIKMEAPTTDEESLTEDTVDAVAIPTEKAKPQTTPSAPQNLSVASLSSDGVTLQWEAPKDDGGTPIKSYIIVMREAEKNKFKKVAQTDNASLSLVVSKVREDHEYYFRVYAENEHGISEDSAEMDTSVKIPQKDKIHPQGEVVAVEEAVAKEVNETKQAAKEKHEREEIVEKKEEFETTKSSEVKAPPKEEQKTALPSEKKPEFLSKPESITVEEGGTIRMACRVQAFPEPDVYWKKGNKKIKTKKKKVPTATLR